MVTARRRIVVFTGDRADFGPVAPVARSVADHPALELALVVGGDHRELVERAGLPVADHVPIHRDGEDPAATARAIADGIARLASSFAGLAPDVCLLYADRFETLAAGIAASQSGRLCAHVEGGDRTEGGTLDDAARRALTAFSHLHFPTNADAAARLEALGEEPWRIHEVGLPSLDECARRNWARRPELEETLGGSLDRPFILFTQHPVSVSADAAAAEIAACLAALETLAGEGCLVVATHPNKDLGREAIVQALEDAARRDPTHFRLVPSLGRRRYHGLLALANDDGRGACAGNSSSGIKEAGWFGCPVVNVGPRQAGRLRGENVLDAPCAPGPLEAALRRALFDDAWRAHCRRVVHPYGGGDAGSRIAETLATVPLDDRLRRKRWTV